MALNVPKNVGLGGGFPLGSTLPGRSSSAVCIVLFTESAGNMTKLNIAPAHAPERALSHDRSSVLLADLSETLWPSCFDRRRRRRREATNSLVANHAALPPDSRMKVPVWPSQSPRMPSLRTTEVRTDIGPNSWRSAVAVLDAVTGAIIWTCILHLTSSTGVLYAK